MEEQLINLETAKLAKEKGFELVVSNCFNVNGKIYRGFMHKNEDIDRSFSAPTQSLLQRWLREKFNNIVEVTPHKVEGCEDWESKDDVFWEVSVDFYGENFEINVDGNVDFNQCFFKTYEEALEKGLQEALKLIN